MLNAILDRHRVIVCAGAGGCGKTTIAAAIALFAAARGRRAVVVTIDPARRLADALGLQHLKSTPERVEVSLPGTLSAMMLEQKPAWDRLIDRRAPAALRRQILGNRFYQRFSKDFAGAHAYAAIDNLCDLAENDDFDTIVLDTPPIGWAIEFFRAPENVLALLEGGALSRALGRYEAVRLGASGKTARVIVEGLRSATGATALDDASRFLSAFAAMKVVFMERAKEMQGLLVSELLASILIATPDDRALAAGERYLSSSSSIGVRAAAAVFNRTALALVPKEPGAFDLSDLGSSTAEWVRANFERYRLRAEGERERIDRFLADRPTLASIALPELDGDVHDLAGLTKLGGLLGHLPITAAGPVSPNARGT
jgi:anion-transporting  ArsA/GET3 family ATPase